MAAMRPEPTTRCALQRAVQRPEAGTEAGQPTAPTVPLLRHRKTGTLTFLEARFTHPSGFCLSPDWITSKAYGMCVRASTNARRCGRRSG